GKFQDSEKLQKQAAAIQEKALGKNHPDLATTYDLLGLLYLSKNDLAQAKTSFDKSYEIRHKTLSCDHPDLGMTYLHMAQLQKALGNKPEEKADAQKAADIFFKSLGVGHPSTRQALSMTGT